jgi:hypothetical protein
MRYLARMSEFFSTMTSEMGARRRRLRGALGDRGQAIAEFLILSGLVVGSLGLLLGPWMPRAAPWGFALPFVFILGFILIERRRQRAVAAGAEPATIAAGYDWTVLLFGFACAAAGAAAFVIAWGEKPAPPPPDTWVPPETTIDSSVEVVPPGP